MNDIEKKLEALKAEFLGKLEELRRETEKQKEQEEPKPWKPESGERYYCVNPYCKVIHYDFMRNYVNFDNRLISCGNYFRTEERAEQVAEKMRLLLRLEQLHDMLCPDYVPDWKDIELKFVITFNHALGKFLPVFKIETEYNTCVYFSEDAAIKAAEILNKEMRESK